MIKIYVLLLALAFNNSWAQNRNTPITDAAEIVGCWERIDFSEEMKGKINEIEPWPTRYQWFCFEQDGTFSMYASSQPKSLKTNDLKEMFKPIPKEFSYSVLPQSFIKTEGKSGKQTLYWASAFMGNTVSVDQKVLEKGTLVMSLFDKAKNKAVYYRYLKRVP